MKILKIIVEVVEGQKLTLNGDQLMEQKGLKRDIIEQLTRMDDSKSVKVTEPVQGNINAGI